MHHSTDIEALRTACKKAENFAELVEIALAEARKFDRLEVLEGPISTGGLGSIEKNFEFYGKAFKALQAEGHPVFNYAPYEAGIYKLKMRWRADPANTGYCMPILEEFYRPLFDAAPIARAWFIPGWEESFGSTWAHKELESRGVPIEHLTYIV
jgi:hypothetical protein